MISVSFCGAPATPAALSGTAAGLPGAVPHAATIPMVVSDIASCLILRFI
jgi:hypothetical protein